ncbi:MAG: hypothetical protein ABEL76_14465 [Bradymonadaceae bacterium]
MSAEPAIDGASIVLVGEFRTGLYQPAWFARHDLIRDEEAEDAEMLLLQEHTVEDTENQPGITSFSIGALSFHVQNDKFIARTDDPSEFRPLLDLVLGTFRIVEATPLDALGMNRKTHVELPEDKLWTTVMDSLVPTEPWSESLDEPHALTTTIRGERDKPEVAYVQTKVEPSTKIEDGIYVEINQHVDTAELDEETGPFDYLEEDWISALDFAAQLRDHLVVDALDEE